jgi:SpoVK/Ycf46/Vps4 family AAA+-type ATPase
MLTSKSGFDATPEEIDKVLPQKKAFSSSEIYEIYNKWFSNGLKSKKYRAYKECEKVAIKVNEKVSKPYEQLQNMVGLTEIKGLVDQIISAAKVKNARSKLGMDTHSMSQHMIFTGNPGSAKTTVARLLAEILKQEDVIETGNYVECGRADLVARYVGWTAKTVREKFREAHGGILFIDEAYSLVDDTQSFGDEAINTIVQEMENQRDKVIVIFAGYPDKMEEFLEKNEGLRSRIAFHLKFPDYNADELLQIMELMTKEKGYKLDKEIKSKCRMIFEQACGNADFGNGRFVRNLLEQAIMKQADRIVRSSKNRQISRRALTMLKAEDFDVNAATQYKKHGKVIGFGA